MTILHQVMHIAARKKTTQVLALVTTRYLRMIHMLLLLLLEMIHITMIRSVDLVELKLARRVMVMMLLVIGTFRVDMVV